MKDFEFIGLDQRERWQTVLHKIPHTVYHQWEYCNALYDTMNHAPRLLHITAGNTDMVGIFAERIYKDEFKDIYTPYGYGGFVSSEDSSGLDDCYQVWRQFGEQSGYVCAYALQHPKTNLTGAWTEIIHPYHTVYELNITGPTEDILRNMRKGHKAEIKRYAKDPEVTFGTDQTTLTSGLIDLYRLTLDRVEASATYHFTDHTIAAFMQMDGTMLFGAYKAGNLEAVISILTWGEDAEYFISASSDEGRKYTKNLIWNGIEVLKAKGVKRFHLGGGVKAGDYLDAFKRRFGATDQPLCGLKEIFDQTAYNQLCAEKGIEPTVEGFFPAYYRN